MGILYEKRGRVAYITIHRPDARNANPTLRANNIPHQNLCHKKCRAK